MTREVTRIDLSNNTELLPNDLLQRLPACTTTATSLAERKKVGHRHGNDNTFNQHVTQLLLRRNGFEDLKKYGKAIHCMRHHLHELSLRENNFSYVPFEILCLTQLTSLSLANNRIQDIPEGTLSNLSNLQWLSLSSNYLTHLPNDLVKCHRLKGLDIHSNEFSRIPPVIFELKNLEVLLIQRNRIDQIPFAFPNKVHTLNLGFNALDHVPRTLVDAPPAKLSHLYLSGNPLRTLPKDFLLQQPQQQNSKKQQQQQPALQLTSLDLHTCALTEIAPSFFTYPAVRRLQRLNLAINQLTTIPDTLGLLTDLEWLNLNDNRLSTLPASMGELTQLVKLGLVQNQLTCLPPRLFSRMQCLQKVDIRRNKLTYFPASVLALAPLSEATTVEEVGVPLAVFRVVVPSSSTGGGASSCCPPSCPVWSNQRQRTSRGEDHNKDGGSGGGGGTLRTMLFYENPSMDHSTGILYDNKTILSLDHADTLLEQEADLYTSLDLPQTTTCMTSKTEVAHQPPSPTTATTTTTKDNASSSSTAASQVLSLREITVRILLTTHSNNKLQTSFFSGPPTAIFCFEHMTENRCIPPRLIDAFPKERQAFLDRVSSPNLIPEHIRHYIRQDSMRQCDYCAQWFNSGDSPFEIGYMARMCMERVRVPVRFSVCSRACALDAVVQLHNASKGWRTIALPVQQLEQHEDMAVEDVPAPAPAPGRAAAAEEEEEEEQIVQLHVTSRVITGWKLLVREGFHRLFKPFQRHHYHHHQQQQQQQHRYQYQHDNVDPPALIPVTARQPIHTSNPRTTAFNHLPRDAIRLERF